MAAAWLETHRRAALRAQGLSLADRDARDPMAAPGAEALMSTVGRVLLINPTDHVAAARALSAVDHDDGRRARRALRLDADRRQHGSRRGSDCVRRRERATLRRRGRYGHGWPAGRDRDRGLARGAQRSARLADHLGRVFSDAISRGRAQQRLRGLRHSRTGRRHVRGSARARLARAITLRWPRSTV